MRTIIKALEVPDYFYKGEVFPIEDNILRKFLSLMVGYQEHNGEVTLVKGNPDPKDDLDIESTIRCHSGDCRFHSVGHGYDVLSGNPIFYMLIDESVVEGYMIDDIYDWMKYFVPELYKQHIEFDKVPEKIAGSKCQ